MTRRNEPRVGHPRGRRRGPVARSAYATEVLEGRLLLAGANLYSYHNDAASTGQNLAETALTPANVNSTSFGKVFTTAVDGQVYAQPLYVSGVTTTAGAQPGVHNVAYVATQHDTLYAIDADTGVVLWQDSFLVASPALTGPGQTVVVSTVSSTDVNSTDITPQIGITGTPAIDPATGFLYLVAKTRQVVNGNTGNPHYVQTLYKVNIASGAFTGAVIADTSYASATNTYSFNSGPSVADPAGNGDGAVSVNGQPTIIFNSLRQLQRAAITLSNGKVYVAFASHGDNIPYHGWILGYDEGTLAPTAVFNANPDGDDTGIWMGGGKIAIDPQGYMYVETGNGKFDTTLNAQGFPVNGDYGDSILKIAVDPASTAANPNINGWGLKVVDYFTPRDQSMLNAVDQDLGSGGPLVLPDTAGSVIVGSATHPHLLIGAGKEGLIYVIDRDNMGHYDPNTDHVVQELAGISGGGSYGTPSFYFDGVKARIYYEDAGNEAYSFTISNATLAKDTQSADIFQSRSGTNSISAEGATNGISWNVAVRANQLRAYSASDFGQELWTSAQAANNRDALGTAVKFSVPTVANGRVFVGTSATIVAYGLLAPPTSPPASPSNLTAVAVSGVQVNLGWQDNASSESGFFVELSADGGNAWTQVGNAGVGATSYSVTNLQPGTDYAFRVRAFNGAGNSGYSNTATATTISPTPALDFSNGFSASGALLKLNGASAQVLGAALRLTDGVVGRASSAFSASTVSVTRFSTTFSFQVTNAGAEGLTFAIQRVGPTAVGSGGGGLGYGGIANSVAIKFDFNSNAGEGSDSTGLYVNGAAPTSAGSVDMTASGVAIGSGHVMQVVLAYDGTTLHQTVTDTVTHAAFSTNYTIDIPATIGGSSAYVGFTASTGTSASTQDVLAWSYTPLPNPPTAPANLAVTPASGTELDVSWTATSAPVDHYTILRLTAPNTYTQIAQVPGNVTTYPDGGLTPGATYSYEVIAGNAGGDSPAAGPVSGTTPVAPAAPSNLVTSNVTSTSVTLTWQNNANNAVGYKVVRQLASNNAQLVATLPASATTYTDTGLDPDSPYEYIVSAYNLAGPSGSQSAFVRTLPVVLGATPGGDAITLTLDVDKVHIDWSIGSTSGQVMVNDPAGLTLNGNGGADVLTLDYGHGSPLPGTLRLNGSFTINGLQGPDPLVGKTLDVGAGTVYIAYGAVASDPIAAIKAYLKNGYAGGAWTGSPTASTGVITSAAARDNALHNTAVGYIDAADGSGLNPIANTILLKYAVAGDTDLNGIVGLSDYTAIVRNFETGTNWDQGVVTYGATVGLADYTAVVRNFGRSTPALGPSGVAVNQGNAQTAAGGASVSDIVTATNTPHRHRHSPKAPARRK